MICLPVLSHVRLWSAQCCQKAPRICQRAMGLTSGSPSTPNFLRSAISADETSKVRPVTGQVGMGGSVYLLQIAFLAQNPPVILRRPACLSPLPTLPARHFSQDPVEGDQAEILLQPAHVVRRGKRRAEIFCERDVRLGDLERAPGHGVPKDFLRKIIGGCVAA